MTKAELAVKSVIQRIGQDPRLAYLMGPMTQTYRELTDAYAEMVGQDPEVFRQNFETALQVQKLPARKDIPAHRSQSLKSSQTPKKEQYRMNANTVAVAVPPGFRQNAKGHMVPEGHIGQIDLMEDDFVAELAAKWKSQNEALREFKTTAFADVHALAATINEEFKVKKGGEKGNTQFFTFDGRYKLVVAVNEIIQFGPELQAAREKIVECVQGWSEGTRSELLTIINEIFSTDGQGGIIVGRILQIRRFKIESEDWNLAMKALDEAMRVVGSKQYLRLYERNHTGAYVAIPLAIAAL